MLHLKINTVLYQSHDSVLVHALVMRSVVLGQVGILGC
jgi:hypothetical protein